jgi:hypothetical protein
MSMAFKCNGFLAFHYVFFFLNRGLKAQKNYIKQDKVNPIVQD